MFKTFAAIIGGNVKRNFVQNSKRDAVKCAIKGLNVFLQFCTVNSFELDEKSPKIIRGCANRLSRMNFLANFCLLVVIGKVSTLSFSLALFSGEEKVFIV